MGLIEKMQADSKRILSSRNEFCVPVLFEAPTGEMANINCVAIKHNTGIDGMGNIVNSRSAHVNFSESSLTDLGYPTRNSKGQVSLKKHKVTYADSTGINSTYYIVSWRPDETFGTIVGFLGNLEE